MSGEMKMEFAITKTEDKARAFAMKLVTVDPGLGKWAHEKAVAGFSVEQIKQIVSEAMEQSGRA